MTPYKGTGDIKLLVKADNGRYRSSMAKLTTDSIEIYDIFPSAIHLGISEWKRLMLFHRSLVKRRKEWRPKQTPMPEDRIAHHFGTLFIDKGLSYFVCRISPMGRLELKRYDGLVHRAPDQVRQEQRWSADVVIPNVSVFKINNEILAQERSRIRLLKKGG